MACRTRLHPFMGHPLSDLRHGTKQLNRRFEKFASHVDCSTERLSVLKELYLQAIQHQAAEPLRGNPIFWKRLLHEDFDFVKRLVQGGEWTPFQRDHIPWNTLTLYREKHPHLFAQQVELFPFEWVYLNDRFAKAVTKDNTDDVQQICDSHPGFLFDCDRLPVIAVQNNNEKVLRLVLEKTQRLLILRSYEFSEIQRIIERSPSPNRKLLIPFFEDLFRHNCPMDSWTTLGWILYAIKHGETKLATLLLNHVELKAGHMSRALRAASSHHRLDIELLLKERCKPEWAPLWLEELRDEMTFVDAENTSFLHKIKYAALWVILGPLLLVAALLVAAPVLSLQAYAYFFRQERASPPLAPLNS